MNSWFEWELQSLDREGVLPVLNKNKLNRERFLERLFLSLADSEDLVLLSEDIPKKLLLEWEKKEWVIGSPVLEQKFSSENLKTFLSDEIEFREFGKIRSIKNFLLEPDESSWRLSAKLNSRIQQTSYSLDQNLEPEEAFRLIPDEDSWNAFLESEDREKDWIFKSEWSSSGKGNFLFKNKKILSKASLFQFPCVREIYRSSRYLDFGILLEFLSDGSFQILDISSMEIGSDFQFTGCFFYPQSLPPELEEIKREAEDLVRPWGNFWKGYSGPGSIDGFLYGENQIRFRSEINFRYTMGRIGWEILQKRIKKTGKAPKRAGLFIRHRSQKNKDLGDWEIPLSISETEPWEIVYSEWY
jgi:hypothetical protein